MRKTLKTKQTYFLAVVVSKDLTLGWSRATDRDRALVDAMEEAEIGDICDFNYAFKIYESTDSQVYPQGSVLALSIITREGHTTTKIEDVDYRKKNKIA